MKALTRKLGRELLATRGQGLAIATLVACATASFVGAVTTWRALQRSRDVLYETHRFPHVFAGLVRAPEPVAARIATLPGVAAVETRVMAEAIVEIPGLPEPASALLRSLPDEGEPLLDRLHLREGRSVAPGSTDETVMSEGFARANRIRPGDRVAAVVNGRWRTLRVVGIGGSPEQVFTVRPGSVLNDDVHYGVLWMSRRSLAAALDLTGAFNAVALRLSPGASEGAVVEGLDRLLVPWGGRGAYGRDLQTSHRLVSDEIRQMKVMATTIPVVIQGVAVFLLGLVVSRMVAAQRMQIGTLKALGYGDADVAFHYAALALALVGLGTGAGVAGGYWLGSALSSVYARYYRFPAILYEAEPSVALLAAALSTGVALAAVSGSVRRAAGLAPAEAMRPAAPPTFRPSWPERLGLGRLLSAEGRMVLRDLGRRPWRALLSSLGIAAAVSCTVVAAFTRDASGKLVDHEFGRVDREDLVVLFGRDLAPGALRELRALPGVRDAEPFRAAPASVESGPRSHRIAVLGLDPGARLHRVVDVDRGVVEVPPAGVILSRRLAGTLGVRAGDRIRIRFQEGARRSAEAPVVALVEDLVGLQVVADRRELDRLAGEGPRLTGAYLAVAPGALPGVAGRLRDMPRVSGVALTGAMRASVERMMEDSLLWFTGVLTAFAVLISVGVVYSGARLALAERERELATLRVVGFTIGETWRIALGELAVQVVTGLPMGWLAGWGFVALTARATASDLMRLPAVVSPENVVRATAVVVAAAAGVALGSRRWLRRLDLVSVLKARE